MGRADTPILISGDQGALTAWAPVLADLAGNYVNLGERIEAAATMDLATLSYVYGAFVGFVHGALIAEAEQLDVGRFGQLVSDISPTFGAFFAHEGRVIQSGSFAVTESPLRISVEATRRIHEFSDARGLDTEFPALVSRLLQRAHAAGLADEELAAVIKVMRT
jgi:3-hydroxyisobutyrate dehydrogenase-like beta-hydroxyacid dehydrogenase